MDTPPEPAYAHVHTPRQHLDWCIRRAMHYADNGDMPSAWAAFGTDTRKHPGTVHLAAATTLGMEMIRQTQAGYGPAEFFAYITGLHND